MVEQATTMSVDDPPKRRDLLESARAGDAEAFGELCREYETRLVRQAMVFCGKSELAEELAQDTLVEAWRCLHRYNGQCRFFTWLCAILLNVCRNVRRRKAVLPFSFFARPEHEAVQQQLETAADPQPLPDELCERREQSRLLGRCVETLALKHQQVVYLRFYADATLEEIGAALGCSVGTVKSRLFHALEKLRRMRALQRENPGNQSDQIRI